MNAILIIRTLNLAAVTPGMGVVVIRVVGVSLLGCGPTMRQTVLER